jgi:hypothetical protein
MKTVPLSRLSTPPLSGYAYVFDVPGGLQGAPLRVMDTLRAGHRFTEYALVDGKVHSDAEALWAEVRYRPDPQEWPAGFRSATIAALAARLAMAFASDDKFKQVFDREAYGTPEENYRGGKMRVAIFEDSRATPPRTLDAARNVLDRSRGRTSDDWLRDRRTW